MKYRSEIDGLRAVAVVPVILFHAGFEHFSGGFVGVDVFFVISGYLITTIILSEMEQGTFSLVNFYERRARRILPVIFLVMLVSLPFAWFLLMPAEMKDFAQSLIAVSTFSSNILFWSESGYWSTASELKPLLHTWSLAVEEQYYLLFPIFLLVMWRFKRRSILGIFILIACVSFSIAQWGSYYDPSAAFYLLPTRGWELAIGATIAFYFLYRKQTNEEIISSKLVDELLGFLGLLMIFYAILVYDETTPFPGVYALVPTIGTGLIILFSSSKTLVGKLLSFRPFVGIGLISYSAYLWHQPVFAYARHSAINEPSHTFFATLALFSFLLAYVSWRFVEKPTRNRTVFGRKAIFSISLIGSLAFIGIGMLGQLNEGLGGRSNGELTAAYIDNKLLGNYGLSSECEKTFTLSPACRTDDEPEILVWGDSYAMHLVTGILASNPDAKIIQMTKSVCGPFFDMAPINDKGYPISWGEECLEFTEKVREWLKMNTSVKYAVLSSPFIQYLAPKQKLLFRNGDVRLANEELALVALNNTIKELTEMGITPTIFSPPPSNGTNLGKCLSKAQWLGVSLNNCDFTPNDIVQTKIDAYNLLEKVSTNATIVRLDEMICNDVKCVSHVDKNYIYRDDGHLSYEGSTYLGKKFNFYNLITER